MAELMAAADLAIGAGGATTWGTALLRNCRRLPLPWRRIRWRRWKRWGGGNRCGIWVKIMKCPFKKSLAIKLKDLFSN